MSSGEKTNLTLFSASRFFNWRRSSTNSCHHDNVDQPFDHLQHILGLGQLSLWPRLGHLLNPTDSFQLSIFILNSKGRPPQKKTFFLGDLSQICFPTPGFLWDLGERKVKFRLKKAIFRVFLLGVLTLFGNPPPHPPTFGRNLPKKTFLFWTPSPKHKKKIPWPTGETWRHLCLGLKMTTSLVEKRMAKKAVARLRGQMRLARALNVIRFK